MACDKQNNVRFRVVKKTDWLWEKAQDKIVRQKYFVRRDSDSEDVLIAEMRTDLREGATYVCERWCTLQFAKPFHFTEGKTTELEGAKSAPPPEAPPKSIGNIALSSELLLRGVFEVMRELKILASNAKDEHGDPMEFEGEDVRTMVIQAYRNGAVDKMIDLIRAKADDTPF